MNERQSTLHGFRVDSLPPYVLGELAKDVAARRREGVDVIDLSQANPQLGVDSASLDKLVQSSLQSHNHRYSASQGLTKLREEIVDLYSRHYRVSLNVDSEVCATMGTKEAIAHMLMAVLHPGESVVVPVPTYPIHSSSVFLAGASSLGVPLFASMAEACDANFSLDEKSDHFFSRLENTIERSWPKPRMLIVNFPHNPSTTTVTLGFFERLVDFSERAELFILHDFAYAGLGYDSYDPPSLLQVPKAKERVVEFSSLSKALSLPGWRLGFCAGNRDLVQALKKIKSYVDCGSFQPLQIAAITTLKRAKQIADESSVEYQARRDIVVEGLRSIGWKVQSPRSSMFVWCEIPEKFSSKGSMDFAKDLLGSAEVAVSPGIGFGSDWDNCIRIALVEPEHRLQMAISRIEESFSV